MKRKTSPARIGAALVLAPAVLLMTGGPALAGGNVIVTNTETIQAHLNADGSVQDARIYEQIALQGDGTVTIKNPVSTANLRNLDGFSNFDVQNGDIVSTQTVNGDKRLRSVSDYGKKLPLTVAVTYKLDGKTVEARDVVGKSGLLEVHYTVTNVTGKAQDVTFDDGTGKMITENQQVVIPMVGSLTTVLPSNFTDVRSGEASMAGDGSGGTSMTFTMTLFNPIATPTAEFGYSAQIKDGLIPPANVSALPVNPLESPSFKGGAASYKGGADSGITLTAGAVEIDANVLKLRDGAQTLIAGLIQLRDGAKTLNTGLAGQAAPGAFALADGAAKLKTGAGQLAAGAGDAKAGAAKLYVGAGQASDGSEQLSAGLAQLKAGTSALSQGFNSPTGATDLVSGGSQIQAALQLISGGLTQLVDAKAGLPAALAGEKEIAFAVDHPVHALGASDPGGLLQGIQAIGGGLALVSGGLGQLASPTTGLPAAKAGVDQVNAGLADAVAGLGDPATPGLTARYGVAQVKKGLDDGLIPGGPIDQLIGGVAVALATPACTGDPTCNFALGQVGPGLATLKTQTQGGSDALGQVAAGLTQISIGLSTQAIPGLGQVSAGLGTAVTGVSTLQAGVGQLVAGNTTMQEGVQGRMIPGVNLLVAGLTAAVDGALKLDSGAALASAGATILAGKIVEAGDGATQIDAGTGAAAAGAKTLFGGLGQLADGAGQLDTGLGTLSNGASLLSGGTDQLFAGANKLASGLGDAATGSGQLADGLATAVDGGKALPEGAAKLSAEGTSKLVEAGKSTASDYGLKYAVMVAGAERAKTEAMAYGAPVDAAGATAYSLDLSGANGDGGTDVGRGVGALALFGAGGGLVFFRRRFI